MDWCCGDYLQRSSMLKGQSCLLSLLGQTSKWQKRKPRRQRLQEKGCDQTQRLLFLCSWKRTVQVYGLTYRKNRIQFRICAANVTGHGFDLLPGAHPFPLSECVGLARWELECHGAEKGSSGLAFPAAHAPVLTSFRPPAWDFGTRPGGRPGQRSRGCLIR